MADVGGVVPHLLPGGQWAGWAPAPAYGGEQGRQRSEQSGQGGDKRQNRRGAQLSGAPGAAGGGRAVGTVVEQGAGVRARRGRGGGVRSGGRRRVLRSRPGCRGRHRVVGGDGRRQGRRRLEPGPAAAREPRLGPGVRVARRHDVGARGRDELARGEADPDPRGHPGQAQHHGHGGGVLLAEPPLAAQERRQRVGVAGSSAGVEVVAEAVGRGAEIALYRQRPVVGRAGAPDDPGGQLGHRRHDLQGAAVAAGDRRVDGGGAGQRGPVGQHPAGPHRVRREPQRGALGGEDGLAAAVPQPAAGDVDASRPERRGQPVGVEVVDRDPHRQGAVHPPAVPAAGRDPGADAGLLPVALQTRGRPAAPVVGVEGRQAQVVRLRVVGGVDQQPARGGQHELVAQPGDGVVGGRGARAGSAAGAAAGTAGQQPAGQPRQQRRDDHRDRERNQPDPAAHPAQARAVVQHRPAGRGRRPHRRAPAPDPFPAVDEQQAQPAGSRQHKRHPAGPARHQGGGHREHREQRQAGGARAVQLHREQVGEHREPADGQRAQQQQPGVGGDRRPELLDVEAALPHDGPQGVQGGAAGHQPQPQGGAGEGAADPVRQCEQAEQRLQDRRRPEPLGGQAGQGDDHRRADHARDPAEADEQRPERRGGKGDGQPGGQGHPFPGAHAGTPDQVGAPRPPAWGQTDASVVPWLTRSTRQPAASRVAAQAS